MILRSKGKKVAAATFGAAMAAMYAAPELQANVVPLGINPGSVSFQTITSLAVNVQLTANGSFVGSFQQWNDVIGKTLYAASGISIGIVQYSSVITSNQTFGGVATIGFSNSNSNNSYVGFTDSLGNHGWFAINLGGSGGAITYGPGAYNNKGQAIHVPEPAGAGLAMLALGAVGLMRRRKK